MGRDDPIAPLRVSVPPCETKVVFYAALQAQDAEALQPRALHLAQELHFAQEGETQFPLARNIGRGLSPPSAVSTMKSALSRFAAT